MVRGSHWVDVPLSGPDSTRSELQRLKRRLAGPVSRVIAEAQSGFHWTIDEDAWRTKARNRWSANRLPKLDSAGPAILRYSAITAGIASFAVGKGLESVASISPELKKFEVIRQRPQPPCWIRYHGPTMNSSQGGRGWNKIERYVKFANNHRFDWQARSPSG